MLPLATPYLLSLSSMKYQTIQLNCANGHGCIATAAHPEKEKPDLSHIDPDMIETGCYICGLPWTRVLTLAEVADSRAALDIITSELENRNQHKLIGPIESIYNELVSFLPPEYHLKVATSLVKVLC